jgi:hypothetical protein
VIPFAAAFLLLEFPGTAGHVVVLPMASVEVCNSEREKISAQYAADGHAYKIWAYCVVASAPSDDSN